MVRVLAITFGVMLLVVSAMRGDDPPPPRGSSTKFVKPRVIFEGIDKYPDQVF